MGARRTLGAGTLRQKGSHGIDTASDAGDAEGFRSCTQKKKPLTSTCRKVRRMQQGIGGAFVVVAGYDCGCTGQKTTWTGLDGIRSEYGRPLGR